MQKQESDQALAAFQRYTQAFQSLDPRAVSEHFTEPALSIAPQGVKALPTRAAVQKEYERLMADLPAKGYARTEFSALAERRLSDDVAVVTGVGVWKKASGEDLMRFGMTYTLVRAGGTWRIAVLVVHDPDAKR